MLRIGTFGGLRLVDSRGALLENSIRGRNLALLALLARAGNRGVSKEKLAAYLWPESDGARAIHSLDQTLYTIRRGSGGREVFVRSAATIALDPRVVGSDVHDFTIALASGAARDAVELYRGPFLDGFHLSAAGEFERWVDGERAALHTAYCDALERLAIEASGTGSHPGAIRYWRRLAAALPLSSRVTLELMAALDRAGDRAAAIHAAEVHASLVRRELEAPPDPSIDAYVQELRAATPTGRRVGEQVGEDWSRDVMAVPVFLSEAAGSRRRPSVIRRRRSVWVAAGAAIILVSLVGLIAGRPAAEPGSVPRVYVADFVNETGDPAYDQLGPLAAGWITESLAGTGLVQVVLPRSRAASSIEGRIFRIADSVWVHARVVRRADGALLRIVEPAGTDAAGPSTVLEPLRQNVLAALGTLYDPRLATWHSTAQRPPAYSAYQEFAAGLELHAVPRDLAGALERFRTAAELDPEYMLPQLWSAWALILMNREADAERLATTLASRRGAMSPLERAWHDRIIALLHGDNERSYQAARQMLEIAPGTGWVIAFGNAALDADRPGETVTALLDVGLDNLGLEREHGLTLLTAAYHRLGDHRAELAISEAGIGSDGLDWGFTGPGVSALAALGRFEELEERLEELRAVTPAYGHPSPRHYLLAAVTELRAHGFAAEAERLADRVLSAETAHTRGSPPDDPATWIEAQLLYELGRWDLAQRRLDSLPADFGDFQRFAMAGLLAARRGDHAAARRSESRLAEFDQPFLFGEPTFWRARISAVLGDSAAAGRLLRQAFAEGQGARGHHQVHVLRDLERFRREPASPADRLTPDAAPR